MCSAVAFCLVDPVSEACLWILLFTHIRRTRIELLCLIFVPALLLRNWLCQKRRRGVLCFVTSCLNYQCGFKVIHYKLISLKIKMKGQFPNFLILQDLFYLGRFKYCNTKTTAILWRSSGCELIENHGIAKLCLSRYLLYIGLGVQCTNLVKLCCKMSKDVGFYIICLTLLSNVAMAPCTVSMTSHHCTFATLAFEICSLLKQFHTNVTGSPFPANVQSVFAESRNF